MSRLAPRVGHCPQAVGERAYGGSVAAVASLVAQGSPEPAVCVCFFFPATPLKGWQGSRKGLREAAGTAIRDAAGWPRQQGAIAL